MGHKDVLDELEKVCLAVKASETPEAPIADQTIQPRNPDGSNQYKRSVSTNNDRNRPKGGTNSAYRLSLLKRNCPEVAKRVEAGEFKTVADAERAAGGKGEGTGYGG